MGDEKGRTLRKAFFGGFRKKDVVLYFEDFAAAKQRELDGLSAELSEQKKINEQMAADLEIFEKKAASLSAALAERDDELDTLSGSIKEKDERIAELDELEKKLKMMTTELEFQAYQRAVKIEEDAAKQAEVVKNEAKEFVNAAYTYFEPLTQYTRRQAEGAEAIFQQFKEKVSSIIGEAEKRGGTEQGLSDSPSTDKPLSFGEFVVKMRDKNEGK